MLSRNRITIHGIFIMFIGEFRATHIQFWERVVKFGETEDGIHFTVRCTVDGELESFSGLNVSLKCFLNSLGN